MAVADFLEKVGKGLETGAKVAGSIALPVAERTAQVVSGEAPQIDAEKRQQQYKLEDASIAAKEQELTAQLETGRKYGTLNPDQQQQYVDAITGLYSHPRHASTLMEKLRKAVHPNGAVASPNSLSTLKNATPPGGTATADEATAEKVAAAREMVMLNEIDRRAEDAAKYHKPAGKSPPLPGNQLPPDAIGADGQPIAPTARDAAHSFVEWNGSWWPVAKAKPVIKTIAGRMVLLDPQTGAKLRDLGAAGEVKVTTRQTLQPGDDGQMHLVNLTSVTAPGGEQIEVEPESGSTESPAAPKPAQSAPKPKVGNILPKTPVTPVTTPPGGPSAGKVVPGLSTLARSKNPLYKADVSAYNKVKEEANAKEEAYTSAKQALAQGSTPSSDQELIYSWVRSNVQGQGRMTQAEFKAAASIGSLPLKAQNWYNMTVSGKLTPELETMLLADIKRSYDTAQKEADDLRKGIQSPADSSGGVIVVSPEDMK